MGRLVRLIAVLLLELAIAGCAQDAQFTAPTAMCNFKTRPLAVQFPSDGSVTGITAATSLPRSGLPQLAERASAADKPASTFAAGTVARSMDEALERAPNRGRGLGGQTAFLFLSGGSLHGAFGAGFIDQWRRTVEAGGHGFPEFSLVTGISTGAILSSFAFSGETMNAVEGYSITSEDELLRPHIRPSASGELGLNAGVALARKGAIADLSPLHDHLDKFLTHKVMARVADGASRGRMLLVGAVDVDTGEAVAFDLGDMAMRYIQAQPVPPADGQPMSAAARHAKDCYIAAIVASSSAPIAAAPVFIDNRMYIDGGARFGLFGAEINAIVEERRTRAAAQRARGLRGPDVTPVPVTYAIINGTQELAALGHCPKVDDSLCTATEPTGGTIGAHDKWSFIDLALRSESILTNQVYRLSVQHVGAQAGGCEGCFNIVRIEPDAQTHVFTLADPVLGSGTKTCGEWHEEDRRLANPVQFFPRYMRCLIDYGRTRPEVGVWAAQVQ